MRLNHLSLGQKGEDSAILHLSKHLLGFGYAGLFILALLGNLSADELPGPVTAPNTDPLPNNSASPDNGQTPDNSQTSGNSQTPDNSTPDNSQGSANSQGATNPQVPNTPVLPPQGVSSYMPPTSSNTITQSPQITAPVLYTTGANDLTQVATTIALTQAFSQQAASGFLAEPGMDYSHGPIERIRLGPFDLKAAVATSVVSDDNLNAGQSGGSKESDTSFGVTPAIFLEYGAQEGQKGYASLVYAPTITRFLEHTDENTFNQNATFNVQYPFQRLSLNFSQSYSQVTGINQDLNQRTTQTSSVTSLGANYEIGEKLSFSSNVQEVITSFSSGEGLGDKVTSLNSSLSYHVSEKLTLGPSLNVGVEKPENTPTQTFEQGLLGVNYQATQKISLFGQGGVEFRQGNQGNQGGSSDQDNQSNDTTNPIFSAGIGYAPFDSTTLSLTGFQNVQPSSADSNQTVVNTGVGFSATQRFLQRFYLGFTVSYSHAEYSGTEGTNQSSGTSQDNIVYRPSLSYAPTAWTSLALYYQYLDNKSNGLNGSYYDNQMGLSVSAQF